MVYYKLAESGSSRDFDFVIGIPFTNGARVKQVVPFNNYHPGFNGQNLAANWIQVSHVAETADSTEDAQGTLTFYGQVGEVLWEQTLIIAPGQRMDVSAHRMGSNRVGLAVWEPRSKYSERRVKLSNTRYYYDNLGDSNSFENAAHLPAIVGSGELLGAPVDLRQQTSIVELLNTSSEENTIELSFYNSLGVKLLSKTRTIQGHGSEHFIVNRLVPALVGQLGMVTIDGETLGGAAAVVMQYRRSFTGKLLFSYGLTAKQALGKTFNGSYNTYLQQACSLLLINSSSEESSAKISLYRSNGAVVMLDYTAMLPAYGVAEVDVCVDQSNNYGSVIMQAQKENTIVPHIIRKGPGDQYRFKAAMQ